MLIVELEPLETKTVRRHEKLPGKVKQSHVEEISLWKETAAKNEDSLINEVEVAKAGSVKMSVEMNLILACFTGHVRILQTLSNANSERKFMLTDATTKIREPLESGRSVTISE